jgi:hypothetical protein
MADHGRRATCATWGPPLLAVLIFCLVSSVVYLVNDLVDLEQDRWHPFKHHRPLVAGHLRLCTALVAGVTRGISALLVSDARIASANKGSCLEALNMFAAGETIDLSDAISVAK